MNSLQRTASEPQTNIICVWKDVRWASGSFTLVKVALCPTNVAGITTSMIACENGIGKSLGGVAGSCSSTSRSPTWFRKSLRNSSLVLHNSLFLACDAARSIWMRSWSALDTATASWRPCIVSIICCRVRLSPPFGATDPCLVFLILMDLFLFLWMRQCFKSCPTEDAKCFAGWLDCLRASTTITRPILSAFVCAFLRSNTWNYKDKGRPRGRLHSDAQVSTGARKHQNLVVKSSLCKLCVYSHKCCVHY